MSHIATILLLGSGELGREFTISAKRLGARVIACDAYDDAPAMQVADAREVFAMLDGAALRAAVERPSTRRGCATTAPCRGACPTGRWVQWYG